MQMALSMHADHTVSEGYMDHNIASDPSLSFSCCCRTQRWLDPGCIQQCYMHSSHMPLMLEFLVRSSRNQKLQVH